MKRAIQDVNISTNDLNEPRDQVTTTATTIDVAVDTNTTEEKIDRNDIPRTVSQEHIILPKKAKVDVETASASATVSASPFEGKNYTNLVSESTSSILFATDEWFARAENLIKDSQPAFDPDLYCAEGKVVCHA